MCCGSDPVNSSCWIDVRDLAEAHVLAIKKQEAGGERIIVSEGPFKWQDFGELKLRITEVEDKKGMTNLSQWMPHGSSTPKYLPEMRPTIPRKRYMSSSMRRQRPLSYSTSSITRSRRERRT